MNMAIHDYRILVGFENGPLLIQRHSLVSQKTNTFVILSCIPIAFQFLLYIHLVVFILLKVYLKNIIKQI